MELTLKDIHTQADALYALRSEIENVRASLKLLQEAATENDYESAWRMGRALFFLGQEAQSRNEARAHYAQGASASTRAARLRAERVEGHFWLGVNLALLAQKENPARALFHALRAKKALERAAHIQPSYHAAGPLRVLARLQHKLPRLLGGGHARARTNFEQAIQLAPANTVTKIYLAELLMETGDEQAARAQLEAILSAPTDPDWNFETERDRQLAREKLTGMDRIDRIKKKDEG
jgi:tetratricopeptide (TPR) repeat protein